VTLLERVERTIRRHAMLAGGESVLVAVSGGADSVALLYSLAALADTWRLRVHALHVDHGLRADSARDAEFVRGLAERLSVPVEVATVTVERRGSLEAAARAARYAALAASADRIGAARIALGHTADDQAETVLMRVLQGAGLRGLAGIPPVRDRMIRPLIECRRADVVAELRRRGLEWVEDPSNADPKFLRNRIRHELLPWLCESVSPEIADGLVRVAAAARTTVGALDRIAASELERFATFGDCAVTLPVASLRALPRDVAAEVVRQAATRLGSRAPLRAWAHRGLRRILATPPPRKAFRIGAVTLEVSGPRLRLALGTLPPLTTHALTPPGRLALPEVGLVLEATLHDAPAYAIPDDSARVAFDADLLPGELVVRPRRQGDRFTPFGSAERKLKDFLIDAKVPRWERHRVPVIEAAGEIVWVGGLRRGAAAPVVSRTRRVLELALVSAGGAPRRPVES
jgi:tRNA(Ile)-lysidine synthase